MNVLLTPETLESLIGRGVKVSVESGVLTLRKGFLSVALSPDYWRDGYICFRIVRGGFILRVLSLLGVVSLENGRLCLDFSRHYPGVVIEDARVTDGGLLLRITFGRERELGF